MIGDADRRGLHCDATLLLVGPTVHIADVSCESRGDDVVVADEGVDEGGLAMVDVGEDADVADVGGVFLEGFN